MDKELIEYLSGLARIQLTQIEEKNLLKDLSDILAYFQQLQELNTDNIEPVNGGTLLKNVFREDGGGFTPHLGAGVDAFPQTHNQYLVVPKVFDT